MLNIKTKAVAATAPIHIKDADGTPMYDDGKPVRIIVHSPGTKAFGVVESRQTSRAVRRMNDNEGKITAATSEERLRETAEDLASITVGFDGFTYGDGSLVGEELFKAVYADPALGFITKQVTKFVSDWGNFSASSVGS